MEAAMKAAKEQAAELGIERPKLLAITALTSFDDENWSAIGGSLPISDHVVKLAKLAKEAGVDGVSQAHSSSLRRRFLDRHTRYPSIFCGY